MVNRLCVIFLLVLLQGGPPVARGQWHGPLSPAESRAAAIEGMPSHLFPLRQHDLLAFSASPSVPGWLRRRLQQDLARASQAIGIERIGARTLLVWSQGGAADRPLPNTAGRTLASGVALSGTLVSNPTRWLGARLLFSVDRYGDSRELRFLSGYLQVTASGFLLRGGVIPVWASPAWDGAAIRSFNAPGGISFSIGNAKPFSCLDANSSLFVERMWETEKILYEDSLYTGSPLYGLLHFDFSPVGGVRVGLNRSIQWGGGPRQVGLGRLLRALLLPGKYDNSRSDLPRDEEVGNQFGSVTVSILHRIAGEPVCLYGELAADDLGSARIYLFGNPLLTVGVRLPDLGRWSLGVEVAEGQNWWYEHSIYRDGLRNGDSVLGHWLYDANRAWRYDREIEAAGESLSVDRLGKSWSLSLLVRHWRVRSFSGKLYADGHSLSHGAMVQFEISHMVLSALRVSLGSTGIWPEDGGRLVAFAFGVEALGGSI